MADKVHPSAAPPPTSFVIQVPKDQVYRVPPPENQTKFDRYTRRAARRRCGCCCCLLSALLLLLLLLSLAAAALYLALRPKLPSYSVESLSIKNLDLSSSAADRPFSPEFDLAVLARNPNKKIGLYYGDGSSIDVYHGGVRLAGGRWPAFYQEGRNETLVRVVLVGEGIRLSAAARGAMREEEGRGRVAMAVDVRVPVRVKLGAARLWRMTATASCDVAVDRLAPGAKVLSRSCSFKLRVL